MSFLRDDDHILLMDNPPSFPNYLHVGDRGMKGDDFKRLADAGIRTTVNYTHWGLIETAMGERDWSYLDKAVEDAQAAGLKVLISDYTYGPSCLPVDWYQSSNQPRDEDRSLGQLSIWNKEAQGYVDEFVRLLGSRYVCDEVNLFCTQAHYGESFLGFEPDNIFYDRAAVESFREFIGDSTALPVPYPHRTPVGDPLTDEWLKQSIISAMLHKQRLVIELNGNNEIWHSAHHLCAWQGAGAGAKFIRDVLDAYVEGIPGVKINGVQYTYWVHGNNFNYATMIEEDIDRYGIDFYVGAEYCEGLPIFTPRMLKSRLKGFILAPLSVLMNYIRLEPWMLENIRDSIEMMRSK